MPDTAAATVAIEKAIEEAKRSYQFGASSYSYAALSFCLAVEKALKTSPPDWIAAYLDMNEQQEA
jgi:hypothetical protein